MPPVRYAPPVTVTEHVPLQSKSLIKKMARASGGANNMQKSNNKIRKVKTLKQKLCIKSLNAQTLSKKEVSFDCAFHY